ncbi:MAG: ATP-binding cassette domain-containing protein [Acutalibacteraceae bacterium]
MHIKQGDVYGLIGRNGAGKTTILKMLSAFSNPTDGDYSINGKKGKELAAEKPKVGALIKNPSLYSNLSAYENLKLKCIAMGVNSKEYITELLTLEGLEQTGKKKAKNFSLVMKQRLGIALALAGKPDIIVLDGTINGLDPLGIVELREILGKLSKQRGITIIISSHILDKRKH